MLTFLERKPGILRRHAREETGKKKREKLEKLKAREHHHKYRGTHELIFKGEE